MGSWLNFGCSIKSKFLRTNYRQLHGSDTELIFRVWKKNEGVLLRIAAEDGGAGCSPRQPGPPWEWVLGVRAHPSLHPRLPPSTSGRSRLQTRHPPPRTHPGGRWEPSFQRGAARAGAPLRSWPRQGEHGTHTVEGQSLPKVLVGRGSVEKEGKRHPRASPDGVAGLPAHPHPRASPRLSAMCTNARSRATRMLLSRLGTPGSSRHARAAEGGIGGGGGPPPPTPPAPSASARLLLLLLKLPLSNIFSQLGSRVQ